MLLTLGGLLFTGDLNTCNRPGPGAGAFLPRQVKRSDGTITDVTDAYLSYQLHPDHIEHRMLSVRPERQHLIQDQHNSGEHCYAGIEPVADRHPQGEATAGLGQREHRDINVSCVHILGYGRITQLSLSSPGCWATA